MKVEAVDKESMWVGLSVLDLTEANLQAVVVTLIPQDILKPDLPTGFS